MTGRRRRVLLALRRYLTFFLMMAFIISCCMILFLNMVTQATGVELTQRHIERAAKVTFLNVLLLSLLCTVIDGVRRRLTVDRPVRTITAAAERMRQGASRPSCPTAALTPSPRALIRWPRSYPASRRCEPTLSPTSPMR